MQMSDERERRGGGQSEEDAIERKAGEEGCNERERERVGGTYVRKESNDRFYRSRAQLK